MLQEQILPTNRYEGFQEDYTKQDIRGRRTREVLTQEKVRTWKFWDFRDAAQQAGR